MRKDLFLPVVFVILFASVFTSLSAQKSSEKVKREITATLKVWNTACKNANTDQAMELFEKNKNIMVVGSDSGEIYKGDVQIRGWLNAIFIHNSFTWEMNRIDIDNNGNTAWIFVDGYMIVTNDKGKIRKTPYRFTGILIKKKEEWKWRLFDGSIPKGE
jgi:ketosteroid isomerase-like protein